jgi:hypothetical protein
MLELIIILALAALVYWMFFRAEHFPPTQRMCDMTPEFWPEECTNGDVREEHLML